VGWSHPFSSGPGIFLYKMPCLNLQNVLPGNVSTEVPGLGYASSLQNECRKGVKTGLNLFFVIKMVFEGCFQPSFRTQFVDKKLAPRGPEQFAKSKTALRDQFQDIHFVVNPKRTKNPT
jgi:hypothetical protein